MFWKKNKTQEEYERRLLDIENQITSTATRLSDLSNSIEEKMVDTRSIAKKEVKNSIDELRESLETLSLELNNQTLDLSVRVEKIDTNSMNWSFAVNEQIGEFRTKYVDVLEKLRQTTVIAVEKEEIMTRKYEELVEQLKIKEELAIERESLTQERMKTLQGEQEKKIAELEELSEKLSEKEQSLKQRNQKIEELSRRKEEAAELEQQVKKLTEELEMQKYELERANIKIRTISDNTSETLSKNKIIKTFLAETESGKVLNHLLSLEQVTVDELAAMTGIATFTVQQIVQHLRDTGLVTFEEGTRRVQLSEKQ
jgi:chromosome segregation ATPase